MHAVLWFGTLDLVIYIFSGSPHRVAYGSLCAWWATLYFGYVFHFDAKIIPANCVIFFIILGCNIIFVPDYNHLFEQEFVSLLDLLNVITIYIIKCLIFSSPVIVNTIVTIIKDHMPKGIYNHEAL